MKKSKGYGSVYSKGKNRIYSWIKCYRKFIWMLFYFTFDIMNKEVRKKEMSNSEKRVYFFRKGAYYINESFK